MIMAAEPLNQKIAAWSIGIRRGALPGLKPDPRLLRGQSCAPQSGIAGGMFARICRPGAHAANLLKSCSWHVRKGPNEIS
jgi:hypothetical protein